MRQIKLVTKHTQAGVTYFPGQTIDMSEADAKWYAEAVCKTRLENLEVAKKTPGTPEYSKKVEQSDSVGK